MRVIVYIHIAHVSPPCADTHAWKAHRCIGFFSLANARLMYRQAGLTLMTRTPQGHKAVVCGPLFALFEWGYVSSNACACLRSRHRSQIYETGINSWAVAIVAVF